MQQAQDEVDSARADADQRETAYEVAVAGLATARKQLQARRAHLQAALSRQGEVVQNSPRQLVTRQAAVEVRRATLAAAQARLHQAELNLGYTRVVAPADGIIGRKGVDPGERVQVGQQLLALTATGHLWPGGVVVILLLPLVGRLVSRVDARWLVAFGLLVLAASLFHMVHVLYPGIDFRTAVVIRVYQAAGLAFLFVPINTVAYQGVPQEKNNAVSGIINLARNMGGDIGIAFVTTVIARRSQFHQERLVAGLDPGNPLLRVRLAGLAEAIQRAGSSSGEAARRAYAALGRQLAQQAQTLAYLDVLLILGVFTAAMVPLVFLTRRTGPGAAAMGH